MEFLELRVSVAKTPLTDARLHLYMVHLHPSESHTYRILLGFGAFLGLERQGFSAVDGELDLRGAVVEQLASARLAAPTHLALLHC